MEREPSERGRGRSASGTAASMATPSVSDSRRFAGIDVPHPTKRVGMVKKMTVVALALSLLGVGMAWTALVLEQTQLVPAQERYFGEHTKAERDAAEPGSELAEDRTTIETMKPTLLTLKLVGIATVLFGIVVVLAGLLRMMSMMPESLSISLNTALRSEDRP